jgi:hypothetical protein
VDTNFPEVGFLTRDEASILFNGALPFGGQLALEIGAHVGWSTVHLGLAGNFLCIYAYGGYESVMSRLSVPSRLKNY